MATNAFELRISFEFRGSGWTEKYGLNVDPVNDAAIQLCKDWCVYRSAFQGYEVYQTWSRIVSLKRERDAIQVNPGLLGPHRLVLARREAEADAQKKILWSPNLSKDCLHWRVEFGSGKWANRYWRGVPDGMIQANAATFNPGGDFDVPQENYPAIAVIEPPTYAGNDYDKFKRSAISFWHRSFYLFHRDPDNPAGVRNWTAIPITRVILRGATTHKTGRPFGVSPGRLPSFA